MEEADKGWLIIRIGVSGWIFLLVPAHPGSMDKGPWNSCSNSSSTHNIMETYTIGI